MRSAADQVLFRESGYLLLQADVEGGGAACLLEGVFQPGHLLGEGGLGTLQSLEFPPVLLSRHH